MLRKTTFWGAGNKSHSPITRPKRKLMKSQTQVEHVSFIATNFVRRMNDVISIIVRKNKILAMADMIL